MPARATADQADEIACQPASATRAASAPSSDAAGAAGLRAATASTSASSSRRGSRREASPRASMLPVAATRAPTPWPPTARRAEPETRFPPLTLKEWMVCKFRYVVQGTNYCVPAESHTTLWTVSNGRLGNDARRREELCGKLRPGREGQWFRYVGVSVHKEEGEHKCCGDCTVWGVMACAVLVFGRLRRWRRHPSRSTGITPTTVGSTISTRRRTCSAHSVTPRSRATRASASRVRSSRRSAQQGVKASGGSAVHGPRPRAPGRRRRLAAGRGHRAAEARQGQERQVGGRNRDWSCGDGDATVDER